MSRALEKSSTRRSSWSRSFRHLARSSIVLMSWVLQLESRAGNALGFCVCQWCFWSQCVPALCAYTREWYGPVISCNISLAFLEDRSNFGFLPILRDRSWIEGLRNDHSEDRSYVTTKVFQKSRWHQVWAYGLLAFNFGISVLTPLTETLMPAIDIYGLALIPGMLSRSSSMKALEYWLFKICSLTFAGCF